MRSTCTIVLMLLLSVLTSKSQTVTDIDGNVYNTVTIGSQKWLREDLKVIHFLNGEPIPNIIDTIQWSYLTTAAYCNYDNQPIRGNYGFLYNWFVVSDNRKVCPLGWHVSTDNDWVILTKYLGYQYVAGGKIKSIGTKDWQPPNTGADNSSNFTALPGGMRKPHSWDISGYNWGRFTERGSGGHWWTTLDDMDSLAYSRAVYYFDTEINRYLYNQQYGFAIRCVSDSSTNQINEFPNSDRIIIYLNPATTTLTIDGLGATATTEVYDLSGKLLLREMLLSHSLDISRLATGLYFIKLTTAEGIVVRKFVKE